MLSKEDLLFVRNFLNTISPKPESTSVRDRETVAPSIDLRVVIPCYNVQDYLERCLKSVLNQKTSYTWEVICVNDGSLDHTGEILETYKNYSNYTVITQENRGFSGARNSGMKTMDCRYYMFIDADDILAENAIEELIQIADRYDADMVEGNWKDFIQEEELVQSNGKEKPGIKEIDSSQVSGYVWGKVIKSGLLLNLAFPENYWYEDSIMAYLIAPQCKKIMKYDKTVYYYRRNMKGITSTGSQNVKCIDTYWITEQMLEDRNKLHLPMNAKIYEMFLNQIALNYVRTMQMDEQIKTAIFFLTVDLYYEYATGFPSPSKYHSILEKALQLGDYSLYQDGCKILWNKNCLRIES